MIQIIGYIIIAILLLIIFFFLGRTIVIVITMLTEVPYQPSNKVYKEAIKYLDIKKGDKVLDIGCGDGRVLRYASKKYPNAEFVGIDINPILIIYAKLLKIFNKRKNLHFKKANIHRFDIRKFNKIYIYLLPNVVDNIMIEKENELQKGCTVISFHYSFNKKFSSIHKISKYPVKYKGKKENIYKWINK